MDIEISVRSALVKAFMKTAAESCIPAEVRCLTISAAFVLALASPVLSATKERPFDVEALSRILFSLPAATTPLPS